MTVRQMLMNRYWEFDKKIKAAHGNTMVLLPDLEEESVDKVARTMAGLKVSKRIRVGEDFTPEVTAGQSVALARYTIELDGPVKLFSLSRQFQYKVGGEQKDKALIRFTSRSIFEFDQATQKAINYRGAIVEDPLKDWVEFTGRAESANAWIEFVNTHSTTELEGDGKIRIEVVKRNRFEDTAAAIIASNFQF